MDTKNTNKQNQIAHYIQGKKNKINQRLPVREKKQKQNKNYQYTILYPTKISFQNEGKVEIFLFQMSKSWQNSLPVYLEYKKF